MTTREMLTTDAETADRQISSRAMAGRRSIRSMQSSSRSAWPCELAQRCAAEAGWLTEIAVRRSNLEPRPARLDPSTWNSPYSVRFYLSELRDASLSLCSSSDLVLWGNRWSKRSQVSSALRRRTGGKCRLNSITLNGKARSPWLSSGAGGLGGGLRRGN